VILSSLGGSVKKSLRGAVNYGKGGAKCPANALNNAGVNFTIIIGKRTGYIAEIEKRNQIADENGIQIRSFDYLTDLLRKREFFNHDNLDTGKGELIENQIQNPFYKAINDSSWRKFCSKRFSWTHFYIHNSEQIVALREYNDLINRLR